MSASAGLAQIFLNSHAWPEAPVEKTPKALKTLGGKEVWVFRCL